MRIKRSTLASIARPARVAVLKASAEKRYVLGLVYPAGPRAHITKGVDGSTDFIAADALEEAAWQFMRDGAKTGTAHVSRMGLPRVSAGEVVESYLWPAGAPDWTTTDINGREVVIKSGDWLLGAILPPDKWSGVKNRTFDGWSMQGTGRRRTPRSSQ